MLAILRNRTYRHLFLAQVIALIGTGLLTITLSLLAFKLAEEQAGAVLGTALAIKMVAYVAISPVASALTQNLPRRAVLVSLDVMRALAALVFPFLTDIWQIYLLVFVLQAASAAFTPIFQATIPDVLPDEKDYTNALSLASLAYNLENLLSPVLAAALLTLISFNNLFIGTVTGFLASAALVLSVRLPSHKARSEDGLYHRTFAGLKLYFATPRLRGLLALNLAMAAGGALVYVNTVVFVQGFFGLGERQTALALAAFGTGSIIIAFAIPRLLETIPDRSMMIGGAALALAITATAALIADFHALLALWFVMGMSLTLAGTPSGRLLRRSAPPADRPALYGAQFALSHACWLITYPLAGWAGAYCGLPFAAVALALLGLAGLIAAPLLWPSEDSDTAHP